MVDKIVRLIDRTLTTRITPLAYVYALTGLVWGYAFIFIDEFKASSTVLAQGGALIGVELWGALVLSATILLLYGMFMKIRVLVMIASFALVLAWAMAGAVYLTGAEYFFRLPLAIINALCYGYIYLASSLGRLWDYTPDR